MDMLWKSHTKVSYGYHEVTPADADLSSYVVVWYCPQRATDDKYTKHRKAGATAGTFVGDQVGEACLQISDGTDKYNKCFADA